jgi:host factor-I protein
MKQTCQDAFLNSIRKNKVPVTVFLSSGIKLQGLITGFDNFAILLRRDSHLQLVYKHCISTIMPNSHFIFTYEDQEINVDGNKPLPTN